MDTRQQGLDNAKPASLMTSVKSWLNAGLAFIYPEVCQLCGQARATPAECYVCAGCRAKVHFVEPPFCERCGLPFEGAITNTFECANCQDADWAFCSARSAVVARDQALELIHRYKYGRALWFEPLLADLLITRAEPELRQEKWDWIVPVPLHPAREREREFNQAERLARRLSAATRIPINNHLLRRVLPTRTQTLLSRAERLANIRGAFALCRRARLKGERIVLVDDVFTTGATTGTCAKVLRGGGASAVCVWTVARGVRSGPRA
jgi:competence protein ComFC